MDFIAWNCTVYEQKTFEHTLWFFSYFFNIYDTCYFHFELCFFLNLILKVPGYIKIQNVPGLIFVKHVLYQYFYRWENSLTKLTVKFGNNNQELKL